MRFPLQFQAVEGHLADALNAAKAPYSYVDPGRPVPPTRGRSGLSSGPQALRSVRQAATAGLDDDRNDGTLT